MHKVWRGVRLAGVLSLALGLSRGQALTIDDFTEGAQSASNRVTGTVVRQAIGSLTPAHTVGGSRELALEIKGGANAVRKSLVSVAPAPHQLAWSNDTGVDGVLVVRWDGLANNADDGNLGLDMSQEAAFVFQNLRIDHETVYVEITVCDPSGLSCATDSFHLDRTSGPTPVATGVPRTYTRPINFGAFNLAQVGSLSLAFRDGGYNSLTEASRIPPLANEAALDLVLEGFVTTSLDTPSCTSTLGNYVWLDVDSNGQQDMDPALPNVVVTLTGTTALNQPVTRTPITTDTAGHYQFTDLCAGTYTVTVTIPVDTAPTTATTATPDTDTDSDGVMTSLTTVAATVTLADDEINNKIDFGFVPQCTGTLGNFVWLDVDGNGQQDLDPALPNVFVTLNGTDAFGRLVNDGPIQTDTQGQYHFNNLCAGTYTVTVQIPANTPPTTATTTAPDTDTDSDGVVTSPTTVAATVTLATGETNNKVDFGFVPHCTGSMGNYVWLDVDGNGQQDLDPALPNVAVTLDGTDVFGRLVMQGPIQTDTQGQYHFNNLCAGTYTVTVQIPTNTTPTTATTTVPDTDIDSDGVVASPTAVAATVTLSDGETNNKIDFGFIPHCAGKIGDFVWSDVDGDGFQDGSELGIAGVQVSLSGTDVFGLPVTTVTPILTESAGKYQFNNVCPGTYTVTVKIPSLTTPTIATTTQPDTNTDSDGVPVSATTVAATLTLADGETNLKIDFGFIPNTTTGGTQGCSPGYWKQTQHFDSWVAPYIPSGASATKFSTVFGTTHNPFGTKTLLQVLQQGGGGINALGRHTVSALLNAAAIGTTNYGFSAASVISQFQAVYPGTATAQQALSDLLANMEDVNGRICPLN